MSDHVRGPRVALLVDAVGVCARDDSGEGATDEMKRDAKEAWRDTKDVLQGKTGTQPHDVREDAREAERRRRARVYDRTII